MWVDATWSQGIDDKLITKIRVATFDDQNVYVESRKDQVVIAVRRKVG